MLQYEIKYLQYVKMTTFTKIAFPVDMLDIVHIQINDNKS